MNNNIMLFIIGMSLRFVFPFRPTKKCRCEWTSRRVSATCLLLVHIGVPLPTRVLRWPVGLSHHRRPDPAASVLRDPTADVIQKARHAGLATNSCDRGDDAVLFLPKYRVFHSQGDLVIKAYWPQKVDPCLLHERYDLTFIVLVLYAPAYESWSWVDEFCGEAQATLSNYNMWTM